MPSANPTTLSRAYNAQEPLAVPSFHQLLPPVSQGKNISFGTASAWSACWFTLPAPRRHRGLQRGRTYVLALSAGLGKLVLMAGDTVEFIALGEEAPRSNHLLALAAGEAVLVPDHLLVLNILVSCNR